MAKHSTEEHPCPECGRVFTMAGALASHRKSHGSVDTDAEGGGPDPSQGAGPAVVGETAPRVSANGKAKRARLRDKVGGKLWGAKDEGGNGPGTSGPVLAPTKERRPRPAATGTRRSAANILGFLWGGSGTLLVRSGVDVPVGRTLQFQADAAGDVLDGLFARTLLDRWVLQPMASKEKEMEALASLVAAPVLVALYERSPDAAQFYEPMLRQVIAANIMAMAPAMKRRQADEKKLAALGAELFPDLPPGTDYSGALLDAIFAPPPGPEPAADARDQHATPAP